ncbi:hypothetical protein CLF_109083 [Clonorchis sinensis]|uniref:Uncharacterized protein n=1 Tax=Clonorchis sinensis TaxID=79923 RepID=G7YIY2_CLOSI|nr:hypothetical protein CLF_109083 [Clonorchis sinensis]
MVIRFVRPSSQWRRSCHEHIYTHSDVRMGLSRIWSAPPTLFRMCGTDGDLRDASFSSHVLVVFGRFLTEINETESSNSSAEKSPFVVRTAYDASPKQANDYTNKLAIWFTGLCFSWDLKVCFETVRTCTVIADTLFQCTDNEFKANMHVKYALVRLPKLLNVKSALRITNQSRFPYSSLKTTCVVPSDFVHGELLSNPSWWSGDVTCIVLTTQGTDFFVACDGWNFSLVEPARSRRSHKLPKRIRRLLEKRSKLFFKGTEDELAFRKMRNRCKSEIRQWNIHKQATMPDLARKNRNVLLKYMRHHCRNKPSAFSLRDRNGEPTSDPIVVSEFYTEHYAVRPVSLPTMSKESDDLIGKNIVVNTSVLYVRTYGDTNSMLVLGRMNVNENLNVNEKVHDETVGQLLGRRSTGRTHQSHRSRVNAFACSDVKIQMRPTCVGGVVVTGSPRISDVRGLNPGTATGYALLMSFNECVAQLSVRFSVVRSLQYIAQVRCYLFWKHD